MEVVPLAIVIVAEVVAVIIVLVAHTGGGGPLPGREPEGADDGRHDAGHHARRAHQDASDVRQPGRNCRFGTSQKYVVRTSTLQFGMDQAIELSPRSPQSLLTLPF